MFAIFLVYLSFVTLAATVVIAEPGRNDMSEAQTHACSWHGKNVNNQIHQNAVGSRPGEEMDADQPP